VSENFDSEGFPVLRDILPTLDFVKYALDGGRQRLISLLGLAWISGIGAGAESGNIAEIFLDDFSFNCAARNSVPSGEMDGMEPLHYASCRTLEQQGREDDEGKG
jgi:hypothetical protein